MVEGDYKINRNRNAKYVSSLETLSSLWESLLGCHNKITASMESKQTYYILHISYTTSEIKFGLLYIRSYFAWWYLLHHCAILVYLPTSILVLAAVSLLTFHTSTNLAALWFTNFKRCRLQNLSISTLSGWVVLHGRRCRRTLRILSSSFKKETSVYVR